MSRHQFGIAAEEAAERLYRAQGGKIIAKRFRVREGEIDFIAQVADVLVFVEVKARKTLEAAAASINFRQLTRIQNAARVYLNRSGLGEDTLMRFDAVLLDHGGGAEIVENITV